MIQVLTALTSSPPPISGSPTAPHAEDLTGRDTGEHFSFLNPDESARGSGRERAPFHSPVLVTGKVL